MTRTLFAALLVTPLVLAGCTSSSSSVEREPAPVPPRMSMEDACGAGAVQDHIGHTYTEAMGQSIQQQSGAASQRVLRPGGVATMDFRADRLNVKLDAADTITDLSCG
ncbi:I78 family peptidase inhibitor [Halomonas sp. V046]|uniref:I78 family peptidase inhibitor n=1 Tax=Halomonas sp. V046 TaxID=3459611 RepID=UPI004043F7E3